MASVPDESLDALGKLQKIRLYILAAREALKAGKDPAPPLGAARGLLNSLSDAERRKVHFRSTEAMILFEEGEYTAAENILAAVIRQQIEDIDMLIIDAVLPGRSGFELITEARAHCPDVRVLLISGFTREFLGGRSLPDIPLLAKPFGARALARRVRSLLDGSG